MKKFLAAALMLGFATFVSAQSNPPQTPAPHAPTALVPQDHMPEVHAHTQAQLAPHAYAPEVHAQLAAHAYAPHPHAPQAPHPHIYSGPDGRRYYINKDGIKTYLKDSAKVKAN